jgi:hypothetical protein
VLLTSHSPFSGFAWRKDILNCSRGAKGPGLKNVGCCCQPHAHETAVNGVGDGGVLIGTAMSVGQASGTGVRRDLTGLDSTVPIELE